MPWAAGGFQPPLQRQKDKIGGGCGRIPAPCVTERPRNQKLIKIVRALIAHCSWTWRGYVSVFIVGVFVACVCGNGCWSVSTV